MLNINPTTSSQLARSVQRDYHKAAATHRLVKASQSLPKRTLGLKTGLTLTTVVAIVTLVGQLSSI